MKLPEIARMYRYKRTMYEISVSINIVILFALWFTNLKIMFWIYFGLTVLDLVASSVQLHKWDKACEGLLE